MKFFIHWFEFGLLDLCLTFGPYYATELFKRSFAEYFDWPFLYGYQKGHTRRYWTTQLQSFGTALPWCNKSVDRLKKVQQNINKMIKSRSFGDLCKCRWSLWGIIVRVHWHVFYITLHYIYSPQSWIKWGYEKCFYYLLPWAFNHFSPHTSINDKNTPRHDCHYQKTWFVFSVELNPKQCRLAQRPEFESFAVGIRQARGWAMVECFTLGLTRF